MTKEELESELETLKSRYDKLSETYMEACSGHAKNIEQYKKDVAEAEHKTKKTELRLDACLYAMVMMQGLLRAHETKMVKDGDSRQYRANLDNLNKVWLAE